MRQYPKIDTLFERDEQFRVTDTLKRPVFADISKWIVTEKVDGTNIRVSMTFGEPSVQIGGRSDNAQLHSELVAYLAKTFTPETFGKLFLTDTQPGTSITLFGEGYGAGIQKGAAYSATKSFILFDALILHGDVAAWQDDARVSIFADTLGIKRVPILGEWPLNEIVGRVREGLPSLVAMGHCEMEGVVARTREPLFDARGHRLILKLKTCDYRGGNA